MALAARIFTCFVCVWYGSTALLAQPSPTELPEAAAQRPLPPGAGVQAAQSSKPLPPLPGAKTPAETFRELLAMSPTERAEVLSDRTEHQRKHLESALREYEALPTAQREARLRRLDLACHLPGLMRLAPTNRASRMEAVPAHIRAIVEERLRQWDLLPANVQKNVLEHDTTSNYFLRIRPGQVSPPNPDPRPADTAGTGGGKRDWSAHLTSFFELPAKEQQKTLQVLPPAERERMEKTLQTFAALPAKQRKICIDSFERFNRMSVEERNRFLKSASRWKAMSPRERETWRALVEILPPTPSLSSPPPLPPVAEQVSGAVTASNSPTLPNSVP